MNAITSKVPARISIRTTQCRCTLLSDRKLSVMLVRPMQLGVNLRLTRNAHVVRSHDIDATNGR